MKNNKRILIILFNIIMIIIIFSLGYILGKEEISNMKKNDGINTDTDISADEVDGKNMEYSKYVAGLLASYKYIDRDIKLVY